MNTFVIRDEALRTVRSADQRTTERALSLVIVAVTGIVAVIGLSQAPLLAALALAAGVVAWCLASLLAGQPRLEYHVDGVVVVNPFERTLIRWEDLASADAGLMLRLHRTNGSTVRVWAVAGRAEGPDGTDRSIDEVARHLVTTRDRVLAAGRFTAQPLRPARRQAHRSGLSFYQQVV